MNIFKKIWAKPEYSAFAFDLAIMSKVYNQLFARNIWSAQLFAI